MTMRLERHTITAISAWGDTPELRANRRASNTYDLIGHAVIIAGLIGAGVSMHNQFLIASAAVAISAELYTLKKSGGVTDYNKHRRTLGGTLGVTLAGGLSAIGCAEIFNSISSATLLSKLATVVSFAGIGASALVTYMGGKALKENVKKARSQGFDIM